VLGSYQVALNEDHYKELLWEMIPPPAVVAANAAEELVLMGFPSRVAEENPSLCAW
jgi:transcription initiation factor TFIIH subunit 2